MVTPDDYQALARLLTTGRLIQELHNALPDDPVDLAPDGSDLAALMAAVPEPPIDPRLSISAALDSAGGCLLQVIDMIERGIPTTPVVLMSLARTALLGASRVVFVLGPEEAAERQRNLLVTLRQESNSLMRLYAVAENFQHLEGLVPRQEVLSSQRGRAETLKQVAPSLGEASALERMAEVTGQLLAARDDVGPNLAAQLREHVAWTFNVYSGVAHGFGWPRLVPGTRSFPGHFLVELSLISSVTHLAFDLVARRSSPSL